MRFLVLLCGCFVALIGVEAFVLLPQDTPIRPAAPSRAPASASPRPARAATADSGWIDTVLARPLFAPDRRPVPGVSSADPALPRLSGIINSGGGATAIFQMDGDGRRTVVRAGDKVGGWRVAAIEPDAIYLEKTGERMVLNPRFAAGPAAVGPSTPAARGERRP